MAEYESPTGARRVVSEATKQSMVCRCLYLHTLWPCTFHITDALLDCPTNLHHSYNRKHPRMRATGSTTFSTPTFKAPPLAQLIAAPQAITKHPSTSRPRQGIAVQVRRWGLARRDSPHTLGQGMVLQGQGRVRLVAEVGGV